MKLSFKIGLVVVVLFVCGTYSCKKKEDAANNFTWSGITITGDSIHFKANNGGNMHWDFGDSTTSTERSPNHIYKRSGAYIVVLTVNNSANTISKTISVYDDPVYTNLIGGTRHWHHTYTIKHGGFPDDSTTYADTSFSINYIDQLTVVFGADTLYYTGNSNNAIVFDLGYYYYDYDSMSFDYLLNDINFIKRIQIGNGGYSLECYTSF